MRYPTSLIQPEFTCIEIGVWKGSYSQEILRKNPTKLILIDPWLFQEEFPKRWYGGTKTKNQTEMDNVYNFVVKQFGENDKVEIIRKKSSEAYQNLKDKSIDWVYIDGNHLYEYVLEDLTNFWPKVKPGGYITGDDYFWKDDISDILQVKKAVQEFATNNNLLDHLVVKGNQFSIQKPLSRRGRPKKK